MLGYLWSVMQPVMLFGVLYVVFSSIVGLDEIKHYPVYVLSAVVLWTYFSEATSGGVSSLVRGEGLLRKMRFPPAGDTALGLAEGAVQPGDERAGGGGVRARQWGPASPELARAAAAGGAAGGADDRRSPCCSRAFYVRYRDTEQIWRVIERALFFGSPIFYPATQYPEAIREMRG